MENPKLSITKTIKINEDTHTDLLKIGTKAETFDDIIKRLILVYRKDEKKK
jgi:predicted CopG family antitoxin